MSLRLLRVLLAALLVVVLPVGALAQQPEPRTLEQARDRLAELEQRAGDAEDRIAAAREERESLTPALTETSEQLDQARAEATVAHRRVVEAQNREARVLERLEEARARLEDTEEELAELARDAYMYGPGGVAPVLAAVEQLSEASSPSEMADVVHMVDVVLGDRALLIDESVRLIEQTRDLTEEAERTREAREQEAAEAAAAEERAGQAHAEMLEVLEAADRAVAVERQARAEIEGQQAATQQRIAEIEEEAERLAASIEVTPAGDGLVTVGGITVAAEIGDQLEALLEAAALEGIRLGGHGYRSPEVTAQLRRANGCPDVYDSPSSSCRVPTARPGSSMHEQGLAIDFTWNGETLCYPRSASRCSGNDAFDWLQANAGRYGFQVLDTEAWHWSTNGR